MGRKKEEELVLQARQCIPSHTKYRGGHEKSGVSKICTVRAFDLIPSAFNRSRNFKTA